MSPLRVPRRVQAPGFSSRLREEPPGPERSRLPIVFSAGGGAVGGDSDCSRVRGSPEERGRSEADSWERL